MDTSASDPDRMRRTFQPTGTSPVIVLECVAGYAATRDGERLAFVVMVNDVEGPGAAATQAIDAIAVRLAAFSRGRQ